MARYKVATIAGYARVDSHGGQSVAGLSAHVLDTLYCHHVVATFRSEERVGSRGRLGKEAALRGAEDRAATLNAGE